MTRRRKSAILSFSWPGENPRSRSHVSRYHYWLADSRESTGEFGIVPTESPGRTFTVDTALAGFSMHDVILYLGDIMGDII
jgi:hypothetical protein